MNPQLTWLLAGYLVFVALLALAGAARPGPTIESAARSGAVIALGATIVWSVIDLVTVLAGHRPAEPLAHLGYAVAAIGIGPVLLRRPRPEPGAEPTRVPLAMVALALVTTAVVVVRMGQTY